jgi:hypothetical protein
MGSAPVGRRYRNRFIQQPIDKSNALGAAPGRRYRNRFIQQPIDKSNALGLTASELARRDAGFQPQSKFVGMGELFSQRIHSGFVPQHVAPMPPLSTPGVNVLRAAAPTLATGTGALPLAIVKRAAGPTAGLPGLRPSDSQAATASVGSAANVAFRLAALREAGRAAKLAPTLATSNRVIPAPTPTMQRKRTANTEAADIGHQFDAFRAQLKKAKATNRRALAAERAGNHALANSLAVEALQQVEAAKVMVQSMVSSKAAFVRARYKLGADLAIARAHASGNTGLANEIANTVRNFNQQKVSWAPTATLESKVIQPAGQPTLPARPHVTVDYGDVEYGEAAAGSLTRPSGFSGLGAAPAASSTDFFNTLLTNVEKAAVQQVNSVEGELQKQVCQAASSAGKSAIATTKGGLSGMDCYPTGVAYRYPEASAMISEMSGAQGGYPPYGLSGFTPAQTNAAVSVGTKSAADLMTAATSGTCPIPKGTAAAVKSVTPVGASSPSLLSAPVVVGAGALALGAWWFLKG